MPRVLIIDDDRNHRLMLETVLEDAGWDVRQAPGAQAGLTLLGQEIFQAVLLDMRMPGLSGIAALSAINQAYPAVPVILLTAYGTVSSAVQAMKEGALDFLTKPVDVDLLLAALEKAARFSCLLEENRRLRTHIEKNAPTSAIAGISPAMNALREFILQAGPSEATVLIMGESGTGKELIAQALHDASPRKLGPLIKVNCAALPAQLLESELFGYQKGAFTGALRDKPGRFQLACGGTIFLDEIGDLPVEVQAKLLRTVQERIVEPLGGVKPVPIDVRIIAATNKNLRTAVQEGSFREDLFFRLNVLEIVPPPLRARQEDIPVLVSRLLDKLAAKNNRAAPGVSPAFLEALAAYAWPGNVRELENILERALVLCRTGTLGRETLPHHVLEPQAEAAAPANTDARPSPAQEAEPPFSLEEAECLALQNALDANDGHRERTARALGISRRTLQYKLKKYGMLTRNAVCDADMQNMNIQGMDINALNLRTLNSGDLDGMASPQELRQ